MKQYRQLNKKFIHVEWCYFSDNEFQLADCLLEHFFDHWFPTEHFHSTIKKHDGSYIIKKMKLKE